MVPERAADLYARGESFALNRVIGGVHYPTDIEAGKLSATLIAEKMFTSFEFRKDFEKARNELRRALNLPLMKDFTM
jgi:acid phosphatase (class A)